MSGFYAINSGNWQAPTPHQSKKKTEAVAKIKIDPFFNALSSMTMDPVWKDIFINCSKGKFPRGFTYNENILSYKMRNKIETFIISNDPNAAINEFINIFRKKGITGFYDNQLINEMMMATNSEEMKWSDIAKKHETRNLLINDYVDEVGQGLSEKEKIQFADVIKYGLNCGYITSQMINFGNGKILNVDGVGWDPEIRRFFIKNPEMKIKKQAKSKAKEYVSPTSKCWLKYIKFLETQAGDKPKNETNDDE